MAEVEYLHICDYAFAGEGGKACIIGVFEAISAPAFPCTHPMMYVAAKFQGTAHEVVRARLEISRPNGEPLVRMEPELVMSAEGTGNLNVQMVGIAFPEPGRYTVRILSDGRTLVSQPLRLTRLQPPAGQPPLRAH